MHGYVRGGRGQPTLDTIPLKLAQPLKAVAASLGTRPIVSYASTVLLNWAPLEAGAPLALDNLRCLCTITGSPDEAWFYLVAVAMEATSGPALRAILAAQAAADAPDEPALAAALEALAALVRQLTALLERMHEGNLPQVFYRRVRPFLAGWTNDAALPTGMHYGPGAPGELFHGASAAQSPLIQAIDIALGIHHPAHDPAESETRVGAPGVYLLEMRQYMLRGHRECLHWLQQRLSIRSFVISRGHPAALAAYNACLQALEAFRSAHIRIVAHYIVAEGAKAHEAIQGTGGSNPLPFLKDLRAHTTDSRLTQ